MSTLDLITRWLIRRLSLDKFKDFAIGSELPADVRIEIESVEREAAAALMKAALDIREAGTISAVDIVRALGKIGYEVKKDGIEIATAVSRAKALIEMQLK
jgi:hypothetical protein